MSDDVERDDALTPADAAAMDAVLDSSTDAPRNETREARVREWLAVVGKAAAPAPQGDLLERTLAAVQADRMKVNGREAAAKSGQEEEAAVRQAMRRRWSRRLAEIGSMGVAAAILVMVGIMSMGEIQKSRARTACAENLQKMVTAFGEYATANAGQLPEMMPPKSGNWLMNLSETGARNNAGNLNLLIGLTYIKSANLYCPGNMPVDLAAEGSAASTGVIGYSYTHVYDAMKPSWDGKHETIVLADKNPMFLLGENGTNNPSRNSLNHAGRGNYLVRADGTVTWETTPSAGPGGDNIWTVSKGGQPLTVYLGTETPVAAGDVFLAP